MFARAKALCLFIIFSVAACVETDGYRTQGAGLELYSAAHTDRATKELLLYFDSLCAQAGIGQTILKDKKAAGYTCPQQLSGEHYARMMQAGFNDIDVRCDIYLGWIDRKRLEALSYRRGLGAGETLLGAGLKIADAGADAFAVVLAAFNFARSAYDARNISLLAALESSTIKTLVYKRQRAFRAAANSHSASGKGAISREAMVFALQNYLLICTPQTIVLDANTFTREPSAGTEDALQSKFKSEFASLSPNDSFGGGGNLNPDGPVEDCPNCKDVLINPVNYTKSDMATLQQRLCMATGQQDGIVGDATKTALRQMIKDRGVAPGRHDGVKISNDLYNEIINGGCKPVDYQGGNAGKFLRVYEKFTYANDGGPTALVKLERSLACVVGVPTATGSPSLIPLRNAIKQAAKAVRKESLSPNGEMSKELSDAIAVKAGEMQAAGECIQTI